MEADIVAVRRFNRFFTRFVGALDADFLDSGMSLAEARILFETVKRAPCYATDLESALDLDPAFLSRVLRRFETRLWIERKTLRQDRRRRLITPTTQGRKVFRRLDSRQRREVEAMLKRLDGQSRGRLTAALATVQDLLEGHSAAPFTLRTFRPGDMGLIASRQSVLYQEVYGWGTFIEVNEGEVTTAFLRDFKPGREQCWVAEVAGVLAGSIFLTDEGNGLSRLRLLYVEPQFHRHGIGDALVSACVAFARSVGYERITLWTHSVLHAARRIYARHGFRKVATRKHNLFGKVLRGETWELRLKP